MTSHRTHLAAFLAAGTAVAALAACGGGSDTNKAGATVHKTVTLRLAMPDVGDADGMFFARALKERSDGRIRVTVDDSYDSTDTTREARLAGALASGRAELAYMPARDWATDGLPEFQALAAPFSVTTQTAMQAVARSGFARDALTSLDSKHVVGLGLVPVEPRQVLSRRPLIDADDFRAASIRVVLNPSLSRAVSALGGTPADVSDASRVGALLRSGELTGAETSPLYALSNGYVSAAPYLTAFGLYAKFQVIAMSEKAWSELDENQRAAVRRAADDTVARARELPARQADELASVCRQHAIVTQPSAAQLAAMVKAAGVDLSGYADAAKRLAAVPGTGPQPSVVPTPSACTVAGDHATAVAALERLESRRRLQSRGLRKSQTATIPDGTYVTTDTVADWRKGGQYGSDWNKPITWTWRFEKGRMFETQTPDFPDQGPCSGTYAIKGNVVTLHWTRGGCTEIGDETVRWSYYNGQLSFELVDVSDTASKVIYTAHPWRKTG